MGDGGTFPNCFNAWTLCVMLRASQYYKNEKDDYKKFMKTKDNHKVSKLLMKILLIRSVERHYMNQIRSKILVKTSILIIIVVRLKSG